jgi:hypothetical protein
MMKRRLRRSINIFNIIKALPLREASCAMMCTAVKCSAQCGRVSNVFEGSKMMG